MMTRPTAFEKQIVTDADSLPTVKVARAAYADFRAENGRARAVQPLFTPPDSQPKTGKNEVPTYLLHLAPAEVAGVGNLCPWSTAGCRAACLNTAGRGVFDGTQQGRIIRTRFLAEHPGAFMALIDREIVNALRRHKRIGVRLNGTSDIRWEVVAPWLFERYGDRVVFYDYTKAPRRSTPDNYATTYSVSERTRTTDIAARAEQHGRVAVVVDTPKGAPLPESFCGLPVADGDATDWRLESGPVAVLLRAKGEAIGDTSGFVRSAETGEAIAG